MSDTKPTPEQLAAVRAFVLVYGRTRWKSALTHRWLSGWTSSDYGRDYVAPLQQLRNTPGLGPKWLRSFQLED